MTTPGIPAPDGAYIPGSRFGQEHMGLTPETARRQLQVPYADAFTGIGNFLPGLIDMFLGKYDGPLEAFQDGQLSLNERIEHLQDVSGYGTAYMTMNHFLKRKSWELMPFDGQVGPEKGVTFDGYGLVLTKGTWILNALCTSDQHADRRQHAIRLEVQKPDGTAWSRKEDYGELFPDKLNTRQVPHTVVIPEDGYRVRVFSWYSVGDFFGGYFKLKWLGGTNLTHLSAFRLNNSTENAKGLDGELPTVGTERGSNSD